MDKKMILDFETISRALRDYPFPAVDHVVGIATGGMVPASLIAHQTGNPLSLMHINYRAADNSPRHAEPVLLSWKPLPQDGLSILLVDDVCVSGRTIGFAKSRLHGNHVITFVMKGMADHVLFPQIESCVQWPWNPAGQDS